MRARGASKARGKTSHVICSRCIKKAKGPEMGNGIDVGEKGIVFQNFLTDWKKSRKDFIGRKGKEQIKTKRFQLRRQYNRNS